MTTENTNILLELKQKLELITSILLVSYRKEIEQIRREISDDLVNSAIVKLAKDIKYGDLVHIVANETDVSRKTVKRKISKLRSLGLLIDNRDGREVIISISPLLGG